MRSRHSAPLVFALILAIVFNAGFAQKNQKLDKPGHPGEIQRDDTSLLNTPELIAQPNGAEGAPNADSETSHDVVKKLNIAPENNLTLHKGTDSNTKSEVTTSSTTLAPTTIHGETGATVSRQNTHSELTAVGESQNHLDSDDEKSPKSSEKNLEENNQKNLKSEVTTSSTTLTPTTVGGETRVTVSEENAHSGPTFVGESKNHLDSDDEKSPKSSEKNLEENNQKNLKSEVTTSSTTLTPTTVGGETKVTVSKQNAHSELTAVGESQNHLDSDEEKPSGFSEENLEENDQKNLKSEVTTSSTTLAPTTVGDVTRVTVSEENSHSGPTFVGESKNHLDSDDEKSPKSSEKNLEENNQKNLKSEVTTSSTTLAPTTVHGETGATVSRQNTHSELTAVGESQNHLESDEEKPSESSEENLEENNQKNLKSEVTTSSTTLAPTTVGGETRATVSKQNAHSELTAVGESQNHLDSDEEKPSEFSEKNLKENDQKNLKSEVTTSSTTLAPTTVGDVTRVTVSEENSHSEPTFFDESQDHLDSDDEESSESLKEDAGKIDQKDHNAIDKKQTKTQSPEVSPKIGDSIRGGDANGERENSPSVNLRTAVKDSGPTQSPTTSDPVSRHIEHSEPSTEQSGSKEGTAHENTAASSEAGKSAESDKSALLTLEQLLPNSASGIMTVDGVEFPNMAADAAMLNFKTPFVAAFCVSSKESKSVKSVSISTMQVQSLNIPIAQEHQCYTFDSCAIWKELDKQQGNITAFNKIVVTGDVTLQNKLRWRLDVAAELPTGMSVGESTAVSRAGWIGSLSQQAQFTGSNITLVKIETKPTLRCVAPPPPMDALANPALRGADDIEEVENASTVTREDSSALMYWKPPFQVTPTASLSRSGEWHIFGLNVFVSALTLAAAALYNKP